MRALLVLLAALAASSAYAAARKAAPIPPAAQYTLDVPATPGSAAYRTVAWVRPVAGPITIFAIGPDYAGRRVSGMATAATIGEIARGAPRATVINGGFSGAEYGQPAGLLIVGGRVIGPLARGMTPDHDYQLSAILCQQASGTISILKTADFAAVRETLPKRCFSAIQAGPIVVDAGANAIHANEVRKPPYVRTMIGADGAGRAYVIVFTQPVNLYVAAEFLRAPAGPSSATQVRMTATAAGVTTARGLGLKAVMNLDGDGSSVLIHQGRTLLGDPEFPHPSAVLAE